MTFEWIIRIVLFGIVHWILVWIMLQDLTSRQKVFGGRKTTWALIVLLIPSFGSILYLIFHPQILSAPDEDQHHDRL